MKVFVLKRLVALVPVIFVVASVQFFIIQLSPGDPARLIVGEGATAEQVAAIRKQLGLDRSIPVQYLRWFGRALRADFGHSFFLGRPVTVAIVERVEPSFIVAALGLTLAAAIGIPAGVVAAARRNSVWDQAVMLISTLGLSMPNFWLALILMFVFSVKLGWLPVAGYEPVGSGVLSSLRYMILPAFCGGFRAAAFVARTCRANVLDILSQDFIRTARSKGLVEQKVLYRHALRPSLIPTLTVVGLTLSTLISAQVILETVFVVPGIGHLLVTAVLNRDYPLIQGAIMFVAALSVLINLAVDLAYAYVDPRVTYV